MSSSAPIILHGLAVACYTNAFYMMSLDDSPIRHSYGMHYQYLTVVGLIIAAVTHSLGLAAHMVRSPVLLQLKNALNVVSTPIEMLISMLYWSIKAYDPRLLVDPTVANELPLVLDLSIHLLPTVFGLIDTLMLSPRWRYSSPSAFAMFTTFSASYWLWVHHTYSHNGYFPYPLFGVVNTGQRAVVFASATMLGFGSFQLIKRIQAMIRQ